MVACVRDWSLITGKGGQVVDTKHNWGGGGHVKFYDYVREAEKVLR